MKVGSLSVAATIAAITPYGIKAITTDYLSMAVLSTSLLNIGVQAFVNDPKVHQQDETEVEVVFLQGEEAARTATYYNSTYLNPEYQGCPEDDRFPLGCELLMPPYPACLRGEYIQWVTAAVVQGGPHCCRKDDQGNNDLSGCNCPAKDSVHFAETIVGACNELSVCEDVFNTIVDATEAAKMNLDHLEEGKQLAYKLYNEKLRAEAFQ